MKDICVVGLGYIGLPTALMLAAHGNQVVGVDYNKNLVKMLRNGEVTFKEEGLESLFKQAQAGDIDFTTEYPETRMYIVAVPTPYNKDTKNEINRGKNDDKPNKFQPS